MKLKIALIFVGILLSLGSLILMDFRSEIYPNVAEAQSETTLKETTPTHITIPTAGITTAVKPGGTIDTTWILSNDAAYFLQEPVSPLVIYAHKRKNLFADLKQAKIGDTAILTLSSGKNNRYIITAEKVVRPKDIAVLKEGDTNTLILITCDGVFDQRRLVVTAQKVI